jgi:hypothetical protein
MRLLESYQAFYQLDTGDPISMKQLVEEILTRFMRGDRAFQQYLKSRGESQPQPQGRSA